MNTETVLVTGMTCEHCVRAVTQELTRLAAVSEVSVDLVSGGVSTVRISSATALEPAQVRDAVDEAGFAVTAG
jgi:copper chaperone CopZ